jgi:hypothetical protein
MKKFILVNNQAIELASDYLVCVNQVCNAYVSNNINEDVSSCLKAVARMVEQLNIVNAVTHEAVLCAFEYGIETVNEDQALIMNREQDYYLSTNKLQTLINLIFESSYFITINSDFKIRLTDKFFQWFDKQMLEILINKKPINDELLIRIAKQFRNDNEHRISQVYAKEIYSVLAMSSSIEQTSTTTYH